MTVVQTNAEYREIYVGYDKVPVFSMKFFPQDKRDEDKWNKNLAVIKSKFGTVNDINVVIFTYNTDYTIKATCRS